MDAWTYLTGTAGYAADHIFVVGDSAGGNLALSLVLRLRDEGEALPAGIVAMVAVGGPEQLRAVAPGKRDDRPQLRAGERPVGRA